MLCTYLEISQRTNVSEVWIRMVKYLLLSQQDISEWSVWMLWKNMSCKKHVVEWVTLGNVKELWLLLLLLLSHTNINLSNLLCEETFWSVVFLWLIQLRQKPHQSCSFVDICCTGAQPPLLLLLLLLLLMMMMLIMELPSFHYDYSYEVLLLVKNYYLRRDNLTMNRREKPFIREHIWRWIVVKQWRMTTMAGKEELKQLYVSCFPCFLDVCLHRWWCNDYNLLGTRLQHRPSCV